MRSIRWIKVKLQDFTRATVQQWTAGVAKARPRGSPAGRDISDIHHKYYIIEHLLLDAFMTKRTEEVKQLSAQLGSTTSLVHSDVNNVDEVQNSASQELATNLDQLLQHCLQTKVCTTGVLLCRIRIVLDKFMLAANNRSCDWINMSHAIIITVLHSVYHWLLLLLLILQHELQLLHIPETPFAVQTLRVRGSPILTSDTDCLAVSDGTAMLEVSVSRGLLQIAHPYQRRYTTTDNDGHSPVSTYNTTYIYMEVSIPWV